VSGRVAQRVSLATAPELNKISGSDVADVSCKIGLTLPGVDESTVYGSPALKLKGRLLACMASHSFAEPGSLVICVNFEGRARLIAEAPEICYVKEHYLNYESVLVRLRRIGPDALHDLLGMDHKFVGGQTRNRSQAKKRANRRTKS
jgi:hypothetical protein